MVVADCASLRGWEKIRQTGAMLRRRIAGRLPRNFFPFFTGSGGEQPRGIKKRFHDEARAFLVG